MSGYGEKPFGLRQLIVASQDGTQYTRLPAAMILRVSERVAAGEMTAESAVVGAVAVSQAADWELEAGGISLQAYGIFTGRTWTETGSWPNRTLKLSASNGDWFPYVRIYGKALATDGGDVHCKLFKCKLTQLEGTFRGGEFYVFSAQGVAVDDGTNGIWEIVQNEAPAVLDAGLGQLNFTDEADLATLGSE